MSKVEMNTDPSVETEEFYDLKVLKKSELPIDCIIQQVSSQNWRKISKLRSKNRIWKNMYDITPFFIENFKKEATK